MSNQESKPAVGASRAEPSLFIQTPPPFFRRSGPLAYAILRAAFGLTIVTHGLPKLLGVPHGPLPDEAMRCRRVRRMEMIPGFADIGRMPWRPGKGGRCQGLVRAPKPTPEPV